MRKIEWRLSEMLKYAAYAGLALLGWAGAANIAQAATVSGPFSVSIYQSSGNTGASTAAIKLLANNQADLTNPMLTDGVSFLETGSYNGAIDFYTSGGGSTIGDFLNSAGGTPSGFSLATLNLALSTSGVTSTGITTLFVFSGSTTAAGAIAGNVTHDDGASIWVPSTASYAMHQPVPTSSTTDVYSSIAASTPFDIYYVSANGDPEQLQMTSANNADLTTPLPASVWLFGSVLAGSGLFFGRRRKRQSAAAA